MKRIIKLVACFILGTGIGWYFGYVRPAAERERQLVKDYQAFRDELHMTDGELADVGRKVPQFIEDMKRQDEMTAYVSLGAIKLLEEADVAGAKEVLARHVGSYYRLYHLKGGDQDLLERIKAAAQKYPIISAELSEKHE